MSKEIETTRSYYNKNARRWADIKTNSFYHEAEFRKLLALLPKKASIIDIGCAGGIHVPLFLGIGRRLSYHGIDISDSFLKIARCRYPHLNFSKADILDKKTLPRKKFDGFLAVATLMHVPLDSWDAMFSNIEWLCKPGAHGYISLPVKHPSGNRAKNDPRHFTILTEKEQAVFIRKRGWKIVHKGTKDGFSTKGVWKWYIVKLP